MLNATPARACRSWLATAARSARLRSTCRGTSCGSHPRITPTLPALGLLPSEKRNLTKVKTMRNNPTGRVDRFSAGGGARPDRYLTISNGSARCWSRRCCTLHMAAARIGSPRRVRCALSLAGARCKFYRLSYYSYTTVLPQDTHPNKKPDNEYNFN